MVGELQAGDNILQRLIILHYDWSHTVKYMHISIIMCGIQQLSIYNWLSAVTAVYQRVGADVEYMQLRQKPH